MNIEKIENILKDIGLTESESLVYLAVLKLGETKVGEVIKLSNVSSSKVHDCLEKLVKKGLVSYILKNNIKHFYSTKVENLFLILKSKKEKIENQEKGLNSILPELCAFSKEDVIEQGAEIFIGFNGIKGAFEKLYDNRVEAEESLFFNRMNEKNVEIINRFFKQLEASDEFRDIRHKGICSNMYKEYFIPEKNKNVEIKYTNSPIPSSTNIYCDKVLFVSWSKNPIAFLIISQDIVDTFKELFYDMWRGLK